LGKNPVRVIKKSFDARHDFDDEDMELLRERHSAVEFYDIPTAWIVPIDEMLCLMRLRNPVEAVRQVEGELVVVFKLGTPKERLDKYQRIVQAAENKIYDIDRDLREDQYETTDLAN
jgi:hypothetical protein